MGAYVGSAVLLDSHQEKLADVQVSLASASAEGDRWFGSVQGDIALLDDGAEVLVELPAGMRGRARLWIDLTVDPPVIRLSGSGASPI
jgi:hypothetical protein